MRNLHRSCLAIAVIAASVALSPRTAAAQGVSVDYAVMGSSGDWFLNFNITNGYSSGDQQVYFFAALLASRDIVGSPSDWSPYAFDASPLGVGAGSATVYNNTWCRNLYFCGFGAPSYPLAIGPGQSLNGFVVHTTDVYAPTSVKWMAIALGKTPYQGDGAFGYFDDAGTNQPGFEGVAVTATPEPASLALLATGFVGVAGLSFRRRRKARTSGAQS